MATVNLERPPTRFRSPFTTMRDFDTEDPPIEITSPAERDAALADVLRSDAAVGARPRRRARRRGTTRGRVGALLVTSVLLVVLWNAPPSWLLPRAAPPTPAAIEEAGLRLAIYFQAQRIESFRRARGRLPDTIEEAGEPLPGLDYRRLDARDYRIRAVGPSRTLSWVSTEPLGAFARGADRVLGLVL